MAAIQIFCFPIKMNFSSNLTSSGQTSCQIRELKLSCTRINLLTNSKTQFSFQTYAEKEPHDLVEDLRVPTQYLDPSNAIQESEWLRETLHKWLDDEYCPEETNIEISKVAARSYYRSLLEGETDIGDILINMARNLESISYKDSFHGAFSSANAAIHLIIQRMEQL